MTEKTAKAYRTSAVITIILSLCSAICTVLSVLTCYDSKLQHFEVGAVLPTVGFIIAGIAVLPSVISAVISRGDTKGKLVDTAPTTPADSTLFLLIAAMFIADFVFSILSFRNDSPTALTVIATMFSFFAASSFINRAFSKKPSAMASLLSIIPLIWAILGMLKVYFNPALALNAPLKSTSLVCYIYMIVFFIGEARFCFKRQLASTYVFISLATLSSASVILPTVVLTFMGKNYFSLSPISASVLFVILVFALVRAFSFGAGNATFCDAVTEGDAAEGDAAESDVTESDVAEGDSAVGDVTESDVAEGDSSDGEADSSEGDGK